MLRCPGCGSHNRTAAAFCGGCGRRLESICSSCGQEAQLDQRFCDGCGASLAPGIDPPPQPVVGLYTPRHLQDGVLRSRAALEGERKLVTVLFADVVGFSGLAERLDPEAVHQVMSGCFEVLTRCVHRYE